MSGLAHIPSRRDEAWRWSDLRAAVSAVGAPEVAPAGEGHIVERLQRGAGAEPSVRIFTAANSETLVEPIDLSHGFTWRGDTLMLEPGADVTRVIHQHADGPHGDAGVGAILNNVVVKAGARYRQFILAEGANLARIETHVSIEGEGAEVVLNGAYLASEGRHSDLTSIIEHKAPGAVTRQLIKGVARKGGRGVFQGKIIVDRAAQKTDARQYHHGMLLEVGAEIFAKPELMIFADDVQCAHGNTAGGLDAAALFYMRSRGLPEAQARAMLIESFLAETIPADLTEALRRQLMERMRAWLEGGQ